MTRVENGGGVQTPDPIDVEEVTDDISDVSVLDVPVLIVFWVLFFIVALQFFTRYVLNDSLSWTEEIARFFLIFLAFIGSIACIRRGSHIYLEFFYRYLPAATIKPLSMVVESIVALFFGFAGWYGIGLAQRTSSQRMISIDLPKGIVYWVVVVACFAMTATALWNIVKLARRPAAEVAAAKLDPTNMAGA